VSRLLKGICSLAVLLSLVLSSVAFGATYSVIQIVAKSYIGYDALIISLNQKTMFTLAGNSAGGLTLSIADCSLDTGVAQQGSGAGLIDSYSAGCKNDTLSLDIVFKSGAGKYKAFLLEDPARIMLQVFPKEEESSSTSTSQKKPQEVSPDSDLAINTICIDPGHGGRFTGAEGPSGLLEKDVNLQICLKLKSYLEKNLKVKVYLTREDDSDIPLADRTGLANKTHADLFISVHNNAWSSEKAAGTETFFLSESRTDDERAVAIRENQDFLQEDPNLSKTKTADLEFILASIAQNEFLEESSELAELVQEALVARLGTVDRGVKQAPFYVLVGCYAPAILVEGMFISNPDEEKKLASAKWQDLIARAIYEGVAEFKKRQEKRMGLD
jgi:N-acetylmuramoyl-L-alanine amidase